MEQVLEPLMDTSLDATRDTDFVEGFRFLTSATIKFADGKQEHLRIFTCFFAMLSGAPASHAYACPLLAS